MCARLYPRNFWRKQCQYKGKYGPGNAYCKKHSSYFEVGAQLKFRFLEVEQGLANPDL